MNLVKEFHDKLQDEFVELSEDVLKSFGKYESLSTKENKRYLDMLYEVITLIETEFSEDLD